MSRYQLDVEELRERLDVKRRELGLSWRGVAEASGTGFNAVHRITKGSTPSADNLLSLIAWLGIEIESVTRQQGQVDTTASPAPQVRNFETY